MANILAKLREKKQRENKKLVLEDINRPLFSALFGISVYGKDARDESIMELIVGQREDPMVKIRNAFRQRQQVEGAAWKRLKDGTIIDAEGFMVLQPK